MYQDGDTIQDGGDILLIGWKDYTFQCIHSDPDVRISWRLGATDITWAATSDNSITLTNVALECGLELECFDGLLSVTVTIKVIGKDLDI